MVVEHHLIVVSLMKVSLAFPAIVYSILLSEETSPLSIINNGFFFNVCGCKICIAKKNVTVRV